MTLNVDYDLADIDPCAPFARKALPEDWRLEKESDLEFAIRAGDFFGFLPGWSPHMDAQGDLALYPVAPDPVIVPRDLQAEIDALNARITKLGG